VSTTVLSGVMLTDATAAGGGGGGGFVDGLVASLPPQAVKKIIAALMAAIRRNDNMVGFLYGNGVVTDARRAARAVRGRALTLPFPTRRRAGQLTRIV
jgi:hypothetical protein